MVLVFMSMLRVWLFRYMDIYIQNRASVGLSTERKKEYRWRNVTSVNRAEPNVCRLHPVGFVVDLKESRFHAIRAAGIT